MTESETDVQLCLSEPEKKRARIVGYVLTFLATFSLGTTEIFAPWYAGILGASPYEMGWAMGSFGIVYMISPIIGGKLSDRIGRKNSLLISTISYILILLLYPQPFIMPLHLILIRALEGLFFGFFYPSVEALVAELCPESQGAVLGNFSTSWSAGMIFSPALIAYMATFYGNVASIYVVLAVELAALGLIALLVKNYALDEITPSSRQKANVPYPVTEIDTDAPKRDVRTSPKFFAAYISIGLFGFSSTVLLALFPTYIEGLPGYTATDFGNLLMIWNVTRTIAFIICTRLSQDRMSTLMIFGGIAISLGMILIFFTLNIMVFAIALVLVGAGVGFAYLGGLYTVISATENEK
ncbi:MAG: MFS transporter, partial [Candidatus Thorarchaeota archaeon]